MTKILIRITKNQKIQAHKLTFNFEEVVTILVINTKVKRKLLNKNIIKIIDKILNFREFNLKELKLCELSCLFIASKMILITGNQEKINKIKMKNYKISQLFKMIFFLTFPLIKIVSRNFKR